MILGMRPDKPALRVHHAFVEPAQGCDDLPPCLVVPHQTVQHQSQVPGVLGKEVVRQTESKTT